MTNEKKEQRLNPSILENAQKAGELDLFYKGEDFEIRGPMPNIPLAVLQAKSREVLEEISATNEKVGIVLGINNQELAILSILLSVKNNKSVAITTMPPSESVKLSEFGKDPQVKDLVSEILERERNRGIYTDDIQAEDFYIDPETKKLFFIALDKIELK